MYYEDRESIYNLVPTEYYVPEKPPMHVSRHDPKASLTGSTFGCQGTTRLPGAGVVVKREGANFGPRYEDMKKNTGYLKKKETIMNETSSPTFKYNKTEPRKEGVPPRNSVPVMGIRTTKNFVTANAVEAILTAPRVVKPPESNFRGKEDYGKVPSYLIEVKEEIKRENEMIDRYIKDRMGYQEQSPENMVEMSEDDRAAILSQLKAKWDVVNANYQRTTHLTNLDSCGSIRRKQGLEDELKSLEGDIARLSKPGPIFIRG